MRAPDKSTAPTPEETLATAAAEMAAAEQHLKDCEKEVAAAEKAAPKFDQVDLAKAFIAESQARRAGLIP